MRFAWANARTYKEADVVLFGVPEESGSHAARKGAALGPEGIRRVSHERFTVTRKDKTSVFSPISQKLHDAGDIKKKDVASFVSKVTAAGKLPVCLGGDHSITFEVLQGIKTKKLSVVYFDAHPDFVCSTKNYYGSVVCDVRNLANVDMKKVVLIGTRAPETEELVNIQQTGIKVVTPYDIANQGLAKTFEEIKKRLGDNIYLSIDMDVLDPAFAPGVDTPIPGGLTSNELFYLAKRVAGLGLAGFDVMETSPPHDRDELTTSTAAKLIAEVINSSR